MRNDIIKYLKGEVYARCQTPENKFGIGCYYHIESVVKNAQLLAEKYEADQEVVIIAAWLHDIASITNYELYQMHHIHGAKIAYDILTKLKYNNSKILLVQECIKNHRGSMNNNKTSIEEMCVADADAISHFDNLPSLLYLAYVEKGMDIETGKVFVKEKLERSYNKLSEPSKAYYANKYQQVISMLY